MEMEQRKEIEIDKLVLKKNLYPRIQNSWLTAYQYSQAMKAGNRFPPILVGLYKNSYIIVDGVHRVEAHKLNHTKKIPALIRYYNDERNMYKDAVIANSTHGKQFSQQERAIIINKLKDYSFVSVEISRMVGVQEVKMAGFVAARTAYNANEQEDVVLKAPLSNLAGTEVSEDTLEIQKRFTASSQYQIVNEFLGLLETNAVDLTNKPLVYNLLLAHERLKELIVNNKKAFKIKRKKSE